MGHSVSSMIAEVHLRDQQGHRPYLNAAERKRFLEAVRSLQEWQAIAFCLTLYYSGCRISEALELSVDRIDFGEKTLTFRTLKQRGKRRFRTVHVPPELMRALAAMIDKGGLMSGDRLWSFSRTTGWRRVKKCMGIAGLNGIKATPKGLRHSYAITAITSNVPLTTLQKWLGHSHLKTTAIYLAFTGEDERKLAKKMW